VSCWGKTILSIGLIAIALSLAYVLPWWVGAALIVSDLAYCWYHHSKNDITLFDDWAGWALIIAALVITLIGLWLGIVCYIVAAGCGVAVVYRFVRRFHSVPLASAIVIFRTLAVLSVVLILLLLCGVAGDRREYRWEKERKRRGLPWKPGAAPSWFK